MRLLQLNSIWWYWLMTDCPAHVYPATSVRFEPHLFELRGPDVDRLAAHHPSEPDDVSQGAAQKDALSFGIRAAGDPRDGKHSPPVEPEKRDRLPIDRPGRVKPSSAHFSHPHDRVGRTYRTPVADRVDDNLKAVRWVRASRSGQRVLQRPTG
jgi:hypothetical protein